MHLTNYSVNKHSEKYVQNSEEAQDPIQKATSSATSGDMSPKAATEQGAESGGEDSDDPSGGDGSGAAEEPEPAGKAPVSGATADASGDGGATAASEDMGAASASKWSLRQLRTYCEAVGQDYELMMRRIHDLVIKTLLAAESTIVSTLHQGASFTTVGAGSQIGPNQSCFELYGFDVLVDDKLRPWLLEVNTFPSLSSSSPFDKRVKTRVVSDMFTLAGILPFDHELVTSISREDQTKRLRGLLPRSGVARSHTVTSVGTASLGELGEAEWQLIVDTHDEFMRRGKLERIFPTAETASQYGHFFVVPRYANLVLARWLEEGGARCFQEGKADIPPWVPQQIHFDEC